MPVTETRSRKPHPELEEKKFSPIRRLWDAVVHPTIRLPVQFPWGLKDFSRMYVVAAVYYVVGSIVPLLFMFGGIMLAIHFWPERVVELVATEDGSPNSQVILTATLISFFCGFGAELVYFNKQLQKEGLTLWDVLNINLDTLNGSWLKAFQMSSFALVISLLTQVGIEHLPQVPRPHQATADMAAHLNPTGLVFFGVLAAVMAPFFEEIIFRGFLFGAFRRIFREGRIFRMLGGSSRLADYLAVGLSAFMFAMAHMDPSAFIPLLLLGVILAELYRRSGSLVCPMLLHAMNNMLATFLIVTK